MDRGVNDEISRATRKPKRFRRPPIESMFEASTRTCRAHIEEQMRYARAMGEGQNSRAPFRLTLPRLFIQPRARTSGRWSGLVSFRQRAGWVTLASFGGTFSSWPILMSSLTRLLSIMIAVTLPEAAPDAGERVALLHPIASPGLGRDFFALRRRLGLHARAVCLGRAGFDLAVAA